MKVKIVPDLFKGEPITTTLYCNCGARWRAHNKLKKTGDSSICLVSEGCPNCEENTDIRRSADDPESWTLGG